MKAINDVLRDCVKEAFERCVVDQDRGGDYDEADFLRNLEARLALADKLGRDWRGDKVTDAQYQAAVDGLKRFWTEKFSEPVVLSDDDAEDIVACVIAGLLIKRMPS